MDPSALDDVESTEVVAGDCLDEASLVAAMDGVDQAYCLVHSMLTALTPPALVRIAEQEGGIRDGGRVTLSIAIGPARVRWMMRHYGYIAGWRFCDEQARGPFAVWRHTHLFQPIGPT